MIRPKVEAEQAVIGAILIDPDKVMPECEQILEEEDFLIGEYRTIYRTCSGYFVDGKAIDFVTLVAQLGDEYKIIMANCIASMPSILNWKCYAEIVLKAARRSRAYDKAMELCLSLQDESEIEDCQEIAAKVCGALSDTRQDQTFSAKEGFIDYYTSLQKEAEYIPTGFSNLDRYTYIERGDFVVIGARPSVGKTALTLQMMMAMSKNHKAAYFSLETKSRKLFGRMSAAVTRIGMNKLKTRQGIDFQQLAAASSVFSEMDFYTVEAAGWNVAQIKAKSIQLGVDVIFVDYLQLVKADGKTSYEKVSSISRDLHTLALQSNIAVIAVCQLNRAGKDEPDMTHLRESGQIEQDAEIILLLHAPDGNEEQERKIIIAKNKEGQVGKMDLIFDGNIQTFFQIEMYRSE